MLFEKVFANNPAIISAYLGVPTNNMSSPLDLIAFEMNKNYIGNGR